MPSDEKGLWERWKKNGDEAARHDLIVRHMRVVRYIAGRMAIHVPSSVDIDDLIGWGALGLLDAVEKFDPAQNIKFATYASIRVRGAIIDQIRSLDWAPRSLRMMARKIGAAKEKLRHEQGREPHPEQIAEALGIATEQVEDVQMQLQTAHVLSLDDYLPAERGSETRKLEMTADPDMPTPETVAVERERQEFLVQAILALPEQMQKVLNLYYYEDLTLKEVGAVLEVTESRVCQVHSAAMKKLRKIVRQREVEDASASRSADRDGPGGGG